MLKFSILGALEIDTPDGRIEVPGCLQRSLLQTLLVGEGEPIPSEELMHGMWGDAAEDIQANALHAHVSRLRRRLRSLEPDRPSPRLTAHPTGYRLALSERELDAVEFVKAVNTIEAASHIPPHELAGRLRAALSMWRGPVFGGSVEIPLCRRAAARYEAYRIRALELMFDAELAAGHHAGVIAELYEQHYAHPMSEHFCEQLMIALYCSGQQAEALDIYRRMRRRLSEELGVEPSPKLRRVEQAILAHDPELGPLAEAPLSRRPG
ncbi:BTAD domain-containing putative transcriptional regulator [Streptomyces sp. NPDC007808]|uniref:AfsR/SARP family transcriptional regulator n=1 Tax=Streptomyces sp. NPDC007808 TaxID=3364779 RepID=UPI0036C38FAA